MESIGEIVRKSEDEYIRGNTLISKHVRFSMHDTLEQVDAYLNSKHISGESDSQGREKPFFNISIAATNVWFRATDIDRKNIKIIATKVKDWLDSFVATIRLREWMRKEGFGQFLNDWGRVLSRYGSAVVKFVENSKGLHIAVTPWNRLIVDSVDFDGNVKIEILELTEGQLRRRITTNGYDAKQVDGLMNAFTARDTIDRRKKDNKSSYIKLYELHGFLSKEYLTHKESDRDTYVQQMHVISYVGTREGRGAMKYEDFTLYAGEEDKDPYMITHLIKEDGRTLSIGAVEHLFQAQWMTNHSMKTVKDTLDISSRLVFQTADTHFVGRNVVNDLESGDILIHKTNMPLTKVDTSKTDIVSMQNYAVAWKSLGNEITGVSESMLGAQPKAGTAWRQTEALLNEGYSLFELMTENKGLYLEDMLRLRIIPFLKKGLDSKEEISAILEQHEIDRIDSIYIKNQAIKMTNAKMIDSILGGQAVSPEDQQNLMQSNTSAISEAQKTLGNRRFFKPSELNDRTWAEQFKDLEWEVEIDITGESFDSQAALTTLNTALQLVVQPGFDQNERAKMIVGRILELTGAMSPIEYASIPADTQATQKVGSTTGEVLPAQGQ